MGSRERQTILISILGLIIATALGCSNPPPRQIELYADVKKCDAIWYDDPSEDARCYYLQEQLYRADDVCGIEAAIKNGANVNGGYDGSAPALLGAASQGKNELVRFLIDAGAKVNTVAGVGSTALTSAVSHGHKDTVKILLEKGADVCDKRTEGTPLQHAIETKDSEMVNLLVNAGAKDCP